jgi:hypothetical protein
MKGARWLLSPVLGSSLFILLTTIGMLVYDGGTYLDPTTSGYIFTQNYFSDIGRTIARTGAPNLLGQILFTTAAICAGLSIIPFYFKIIKIFPNSRMENKLAQIAAWISIPTGIMYSLVGIGPADTMRLLHYGSMFLALIGTITLSILHILIFIRTKYYPKFYVYLYFMLAAIILFFIIFKIWGPPDTYPEGLIMQVVSQKVTIYSEMIIIAIQSIGAYQFAIKSKIK